MPLRLAHLSDPHLLSLAGATVLDFANKRWIGGLNLLINRSRHHSTEVFESMVADLNEGSADHVLVTGDITNVAHEEEFRFAKGFFDRIRLGPGDVTVIPGNHDTYVSAGVEYFDKYFGGFCRADTGWEWSEGRLWPTVRVRGPVAIVALSTGLVTPWFTAWGQLGDEQLERLEQVLTDPRLKDKFRVVAIHHPPAGRAARRKGRGLRDHEAFAAVVARAGAELVLHGHEHLDLREALEGPDGRAIPVRGIQSATFVGGKSEHRARYRVYEVAEEGAASGGGRPILAGERLRVWSIEERRFVDDSLTAKCPTSNAF